MANYYENLYKAPVLPRHEYHGEVEQNIHKYEEDQEHEKEKINEEPSIDEVRKIINKKKMVKQQLM
jgi:hypothetical protein